jgi:1-acyl-sn-glycerol-3-phosphate acyltransferase
MGLLYQICKKGAFAYYSIFFKLEVEGLEQVDTTRNYVVCANHLNVNDPFILGGLLPFETRFMAKKELFKYKIVAAFLGKIGVFPVERDANDLKAIKVALTVLKNKGSLGLFPEATRNKGYEPLAVKAGVAMLAIKTKTPVLPITIDSHFKFWGPVRVVFHNPVELDHYYDQKTDTEELERISQEIVNGLYSDMKYYKPLLDKPY